MFSVLVCDDHPAIRLSLRMYATQAVPGCIFDETADATELLARLSQSRRCDLLVLDVHMPGRSGLSVLREVKELRPELPVMMFSADETEPAVTAALQSGATSYLFKSSDEATLVGAFRDAARAQITLPPAALPPGCPPRGPRPAPASEDDILSQLTARQRDVLKCLLRGMSAKQAARALGISDGTVKTHTVVIFRAFDVHSRSQVVAEAWRRGIGFDE